MFPVVESQRLVNCHINSFVLSLLVNEFNSKEILQITFDKILIRLHPVKVTVSTLECFFVPFKNIILYRLFNFRLK